MKNQQLEWTGPSKMDAIAGLYNLERAECGSKQALKTIEKNLKNAGYSQKQINAYKKQCSL